MVHWEYNKTNPPDATDVTQYCPVNPTPYRWGKWKWPWIAIQMIRIMDRHPDDKKLKNMVESYLQRLEGDEEGVYVCLYR